MSAEAEGEGDRVEVQLSRCLAPLTRPVALALEVPCQDLGEPAEDRTHYDANQGPCLCRHGRKATEHVAPRTVTPMAGCRFLTFGFAIASATSAGSEQVVADLNESLSKRSSALTELPLASDVLRLAFASLDC